MVAIAKVTSKGQTTIPQEVRESMHVKPGDTLMDRVRAGVRVHVLIDGFGLLGLSETTRQRLRNAGVWLAVFHPVRPW